MSQVLFFGAYLIVGIPLALLLARADSEPEMAALSLLMFCILGAISSSLAFIASTQILHRAPSVVNGFCAGALAAASFFLVLCFVPLFDLWPCLLLALVLSALVSVSSSIFARRYD